MDQLPSVLQKEIWEYVRGDRAYWKTKYERVLIHLDGVNLTLEGESTESKTKQLWKRIPMNGQWDDKYNPIGLGITERKFRDWSRTQPDLPIYPLTHEEWATVGHARCHWKDFVVNKNPLL
jgi:hypothetical protein